MVQFAVHTPSNFSLIDGSDSSNLANCKNFEEKVKSFAVSEDGKLIAWISSGQVSVAVAPSWTKIGTLKHPRAQELCVSSKGSYLAIYEAYVKTQDQSQMQPNLSIYDVAGKKLLKAFFQQSQNNWKPQWTKDETIFARNVTNEVHFYKADDLQTIVKKKILQKVRSFSLSPSIKNHYVTFFVPSVKAAPAYVHLFRYPNFDDSSAALANKSFFKVDTVENLWNKQSSACLLLTASEVDKSGTSYYGEQMLYYLNTHGDTSRIILSKSGNIHSVDWCPSGQEFFVVYGTTPANATLFNHKCEEIADFGTGPRNTVLVNPVGNIVLLGGFGNISGRYETWDIKGKKKIGDQECPDTTHITWSPCGQYILSSTCSPRLRVNNGYKLWHYTAALMQDKSEEELFAASWIPDPEAAQPFAISVTPVTGVKSSTAVASKKKYVPPSLRGVNSPIGTSALQRKYLSEVDKETITPPKAAPSKSALKNKKRRETAKKKREEEVEKGETNEGASDSLSPEPAVKSVAASIEMTGDPDKDKKIKNLKKKLDAIAKLKSEQENGKVLEKNQLSKIATEESLLKELQELTI